MDTTCAFKFTNEMARAIVLTSEQWYLLSGTENTDGGLIIITSMKCKKHQVSINPRKLVNSSNSLHMFYLHVGPNYLQVDSLSIL
jgi:hypothetical protein